MRRGMRLSVCIALAHLVFLPLRQLHAQEGSTPLPQPRLLSPRAVSTELTKRYPPSYQRMSATGAVQLRAHIDSAGRADSVYVVSSSGYARLDRAATSVVHGARFVPATGPEGRSNAWVEVELQFGDAPTQGGSKPPSVVNRADVAIAVMPRYPAELRRRKVRVSVPVRLTVDAAGHVVNVETPDPGCFPTATEAALTGARQLVFNPAAEGEPATRITAATVTFGDSVAILVRGDSQEPRKREELPDSEPTPSGVTKRPQLQNVQQVQNALVRNYPRDLRDMGIGGTVVIWFGINEKGRVRQLQISEGSGNCAFDRAGLAVAGIMRFSPALSNGAPRAVWVEIPIIFSSR